MFLFLNLKNQSIKKIKEKTNLFPHKTFVFSSVCCLWWQGYTVV